LWTWFWQAWMLWTSYTMFCILGIIWLTWHVTFCQHVQFLLTSYNGITLYNFLHHIYVLYILKCCYLMPCYYMLYCGRGWHVKMMLTWKNDVVKMLHLYRHVHLCWHHILALLVTMLLIKSILLTKFNVPNRSNLNVSIMWFFLTFSIL
jgi:hypothetical protein